MQQHHHLHKFDEYHYDSAVHDDYPAHRHEWSGNNRFDTVIDHSAVDFDDRHADDYKLTVGPDHDSPGYDIRWADQHSRTTTTATVAGDRQ